MSTLKSLRYKIAAQIISLLAFILLPLALSRPFFLNAMILSFILAILSSAWNILGGYAGQFSLGHASFFGIGAYVTALVFTILGVTPYLGMIIGGIVSAISAIAIGYPCFRLKGPFFVLITIAFAETICVFVTNRIELGGAYGIWIPVVHEPAAFYVFQFHSSKLPYYYIALALLLITLYMSQKVKKSHFGLILAAIRGNEDAAESIGINPMKYKLLAASISGFFAGIAGALYAQYYLFIDPFTVLGFTISAEAAIAAIIGGKGTIYGPLIGSLIMTLVGEYVRAVVGITYYGAHMLIFGVIVIVLSLIAPKGIIGLIVKKFKVTIP